MKRSKRPPSSARHAVTRRRKVSGLSPQSIVVYVGRVRSDVIFEGTVTETAWRKCINPKKSSGSSEHNEFMYKLSLYKLLIRPILTYAAPVWSNTSNTNYRHPQTLQSKCLRVIGNNPKRTPIHFLHSSLHIEPLYEFIHRLSEKFFHQCSIHHSPLVRQIGDCTIVDLQHRYKKYIHKRTKHLLL